MEKDELAAWDRELAIATMADDAEAAERLLAMLIQSLDQVADELSRQLTEEDWDGLWQTAHKLKGSSQLCCTPALTALALDLETTSINKDNKLIIKLLTDLKRQSDRLRSLPLA